MRLLRRKQTPILSLTKRKTTLRMLRSRIKQTPLVKLSWNKTNQRTKRAKARKKHPRRPSPLKPQWKNGKLPSHQPTNRIPSGHLMIGTGGTLGNMTGGGIGGEMTNMIRNFGVWNVTRNQVQHQAQSQAVLAILIFSHVLNVPILWIWRMLFQKAQVRKKMVNQKQRMTLRKPKRRSWIRKKKTKRQLMQGTWDITAVFMKVTTSFSDSDIWGWWCS